MNDERFGGVADTGALGLRVVRDLTSHIEVGGRIHIHVAVACAIDHIRDSGVLQDRLDQRGPTARNQAIDEATLLHELGRRLTSSVVDHHERIGRQAGLRERIAKHGGDGQVGVDR